MFFDQDFKEYQNVLFIPDSPNYPGVDFLMWDLEDRVLFAFQIAIEKLNDRKNVDHFMTGRNGPSLKSKWANLFNIEEPDVYFVWIASNSTTDKITKSMPNKLHVSFSSISSQFLALANNNN